MSQKQIKLPVVVVVVAILLITIVARTHSQSCGIEGVLGQETIKIDGIPDSLKPEKEIWQAKTVNVKTKNGSSAVSHPHVKYVTALHYASKTYQFKATNAFPNFIRDQNTQVIIRNVTFYCTDGTESRQDFEISIVISDKEQPEFLKPEYALEITEGWPVYDGTNATKKSINQGTIIIVGDADLEFVNANLTFSSALKDSNGEEVIQVVGTPLWADWNIPSGAFYYRVDLCLKKQLEIGDHQFFVFAESRFNSGSTKIVLTVNELQ